MMLILLAFLTILNLIQVSYSQSLRTALSSYTNATTFLTYLDEINADITTSSNQALTVLVPTNDAFSAFAEANGDIQDLPADLRRAYLRYHVLAVPVTQASVERTDDDLTLPTILKDEQYNNRSAGTELLDLYGAQATGQVLVLSKTTSSSGNPQYLVRRQSDFSTSTSLAARGGLASNATVTFVDGVWNGGAFQFIDTILAPPTACSTTIRSVFGGELAALDAALNRTGLYPMLDSAQNVTCLAPVSAAFMDAGSPEVNLAPMDLTKALAFHTLPQPLYSSFLDMGTTMIKSLANLTVMVTKNDSGIYFNDAKVVQRNVLTNNGLVHMLDRVMSPLPGESLGIMGNDTTGNNGTMGGNSTMGSGNSTGGSSSNFAVELPQLMIAIVLGFVVVNM